ncbi:MAG: DnaA ATPase domain-containing protein [Planctomycetota bacterium]
MSAAFGRLRGERARALWLGDARPAAFRRGLFTLDVATPAAKAAIDVRYRTDLESLFQQMTGSPVRLLTRLSEDGAAGPDAALASPSAPGASLAVGTRVVRPPTGGAPGAMQGVGTPARADSFVPTAACTLALRAAEHFVLAPEAGWNPLFVYGTAGCGKTELARHVLARLEAGKQTREPLVLSGPALTRDVTRAARMGTLGTLQSGWATADLLVLDEAHRLRGQRRCQAEAGTLISAALSRGARVLILSRHAPRDILRLDDRLRSWFLGGMVVSMGEPDTADRGAVLAAVASALDVEVAEEVVQALAGRCPGTLADAVRTLERAARAARQAGKALDLDQLDPRLAAPTPAELGLAAIIEAVSRETGISAERIGSAEKTRAVAAARHLCAYLGTHSLGLPVRQVCRSLGHVSPSLAGYARRAVTRRRAEDPAFDELVHDLQARLQGAQRDFAW